MTFTLRLKLKLLLLLVAGIVMLGGQLGGGTTEAVCGTCHQVFKGTQGVGWGCTRTGSTDCVATRDRKSVV